MSLTVRCMVLLLLPPNFVIAAEPVKADRILIEKATRTMTLLRGDAVLKQYKVALGGEPKGPKRQQGDHRTPEGRYHISGRNAKSKFHLALRVSYPNAEDLRRAQQLHVSPGGDIMIHGLPNGAGAIGAAHRLIDWTDGCIAVTNDEVEEIWKLVPDGAAVEIVP